MSDIRGYQASFNGGVLSPSLAARIDLSKFASGLEIGENVFVLAHGGVANFAGTYFMGETKFHGRPSRLIPFQFNSEQTYVIEAGHNYFRFFTQAGPIMSGSVPYEIATPFADVQVRDLNFVQEADVMYIVHPDFAPRKLLRLGHDNWQMQIITFGTTIPAPTITAAVLSSTSGEAGYTPTVYRYRVAAVRDNGEEGLPSGVASVTNDLSVSGGSNRITAGTVANATHYVFYKESNGFYGYIGSSPSGIFDDWNVIPDTSRGPQAVKNHFTGAGNFPRCVAFIEQRLAFASTRNEPQAVWLSQTAQYENFNTSFPIQASDAITLRIKSRKVEEIRALLQTKGMMIFSSEAEWIITGGSQSDAITPTTIKIDNQGYRGSGRVQPLVVGDVVVFCQVRGGVIRDFSYDFSRDNYAGRDLTILCRHFFENREVVSWGYAQAPHSIIYVVLSDGTVKTLTYMQEHEVWGWTERNTDGDRFEDVVVIPEGGEDVPYFIVRRTVNGVTKRYIERQHTRRMDDVKDAFFVDSGLSYRGTPVSSVSGLNHLEGRTVAVLADGNVIHGLKVTGGALTLPFAASVIHAGLPMPAKIKTLPLELGQVAGIGTVQGRKKTISNLTLRVEQSRGLFIGAVDGDRNDRRMVEWKQRAGEEMGAPIQLFTGDVPIRPTWTWDVAGSVYVKQFDPLPMTVLALMPDVTIGL